MTEFNTSGRYYTGEEKRRMMADEMLFNPVQSMIAKDLINRSEKEFSHRFEGTFTGASANIASDVPRQEFTLDSLQKMLDEMPEMPVRVPQTVIVGVADRIKWLYKLIVSSHTMIDSITLMKERYGGQLTAFNGIPVIEIDTDSLSSECAELRERYGMDVKIIWLHEVDGENYAINLTEMMSMDWPCGQYKQEPRGVFTGQKPGRSL